MILMELSISKLLQVKNKVKQLAGYSQITIEDPLIVPELNFIVTPG